MGSVKVTWTLSHHGWAFCKVADHQGEAEVFASYVTDAPEDFLRGIASLVLAETEARVEFQGEPTVYRWFFQRDASDVAIRLVRAGSSRDPDDSGTVVWSSRQPINTLCRAVIRAFDQVEHDLGAAGYQEQWGRPFPRSELEGLRTAWRNALVGGS
ncbi:hypothetical protein [Streptomyces sp. NPDC056468]|uniref:hypothetical protein n=1 Tax=Streptomyces sp. NPDC056468 TaxID=3345830 RepID=UPI0036A925B9